MGRGAYNKTDNPNLNCLFEGDHLIFIIIIFTGNECHFSSCLGSLKGILDLFVCTSQLNNGFLCLSICFIIYHHLILQASRRELIQMDFEAILKYFRISMPKKYLDEEEYKKLVNSALGFRVCADDVILLTLLWFSSLRWLNIVLWVVSGNSRDGTCEKSKGTRKMISQNLLIKIL